MKMRINNIQTLFLKNIGVKQTVFKNAFWLAFAEVFSRFLEFILIIYIIRALGAVEFGIFSFAFAFVSLFSIVSDFGLSDIATRELSQNKETEKEYSAVFSLRFFLSVAVFILILCSSFFITKEYPLRFIIWILGAYALVNEFFYIVYAFLRARQKMEYEFGVKVIRALAMIFILFFILLKIPSIKNICYGYLFSNLTVLILVLLIFNFKIQPLKFDFNRNIWRKFLKISWPLGIAAIFGSIFLSIDSVIMGSFGQIAQAGFYNAGRKIIVITTIPTALVYMSFFPALSKFFKESKEKFQKMWGYYMKLMIVLALPATVGGWVFASKIINLAYGQQFSTSIAVFQILIFMAGINFVYNPYILVLIVSGQQKKYLLVNLIGAMVNVISNLILIPRYNLYGASASAVITYIVLFLLAKKFSEKTISVLSYEPGIFKVLAIAVLSSLAMLFVITQPLIYGLNVVLAIIIGAVIYLLFLFFLAKNIFRVNLL